MTPDRDSRGQFRILAIDGGGVRGALAARILTNVEAYLNREDGKAVHLGRRFDLIAGTSTGGIIALALAIGISAQDTLSFYGTFIPEIFGKSNKNGLLRSLTAPMYRVDALRNALMTIFEDKTLRDVVTDVCIPAVALQNAMPRLYKSGYLARNAGRLDEKLLDIALATSAAPAFFPAHSGKFSTNLVDGGMCANNPSMIALVEAMQFETPSKRGIPPPIEGKRQFADIAMLSIGTGEPCGMPYKMDKLKAGGLMAWSMNLDRTRPIFPPAPVIPAVEMLMYSQSQLAHFQTSFLLGSDNYLRVNPRLAFPMRLDDIAKVGELKNLGDLTADIENYLRRNFLL